MMPAEARASSAGPRAAAGGRTTVEGVEGNNLQQNTRLGVTLALPVTRQISVKLYGSTGVSTRTGSNFTAGGVLLQYHCRYTGKACSVPRSSDSKKGTTGKNFRLSLLP